MPGEEILESKVPVISVFSEDGEDDLNEPSWIPYMNTINNKLFSSDTVDIAPSVIAPNSTV